MSKHFKQEELDCPCCGAYVPNVALLVVLEDVRNHFGVMVRFNSSTRCDKHNAKVGGAKHSQHLLGNAADIVVFDVEPKEVYEYLNNTPYSDLIGLGRYNSFTHIDVRGTRARW